MDGKKPHAVALWATFRRLRTGRSIVVVPLAVFSSPVSAPLPRTRERVRLRDLVTMISTESILAGDRGLRPRALGDEGGDVAALLAGDDGALRGLASERSFWRGAGVAGDGAALRGLASERRLWREAGVVAVAAGALPPPRPLLSTSLSCCPERGA